MERKERKNMRIKKFITGVLAAAVLVSSVPAMTTTVKAETTATQTATDATPEQEVTVKKPAKATVAAKKKSVKVTIKKVKDAKGYEVQYSTSKKFTKKTTKTSKTSKTTYTVKKLKGKKVYYVRVRAYKVVDGKKVYSKWTTVKKVKTK